MPDFEEAYDFVQKWEGGAKFTQDNEDPGGATKFGISFRFLKGLPVKDADINKDGKLTWQDVQALAPRQAKEIYKAYFWDKLSLDSIDGVLAAVLFDSAVNIGLNRVAKNLQNIVGAKPDGVIGPATIMTVNDLPPDAVAKAMLFWRECHYRRLYKNESWAKKYIDGWLNRLADLYAQFNIDAILG